MQCCHAHTSMHKELDAEWHMHARSMRQGLRDSPIAAGHATPCACTQDEAGPHLISCRRSRSAPCRLKPSSSDGCRDMSKETLRPGSSSLSSRRSRPRPVRSWQNCASTSTDVCGKRVATSGRSAASVSSRACASATPCTQKGKHSLPGATNPTTQCPHPRCDHQASGESPTSPSSVPSACASSSFRPCFVEWHGRSLPSPLTALTSAQRARGTPAPFPADGFAANPDREPV